MTRVSRQVAFDMCAENAQYPELDKKKQMPSFMSMLTCEVYLSKANNNARDRSLTIGVARNLCSGADNRDAQGAEIETPKASRGEGNGEGVSSSPAD